MRALARGRERFPVTEHVGDRTIALPFYPTMTEAEVERVALALREAVAS